MRIFIFLFTAFSLLGACQNSSYAKFKEKGQSKSRLLVEELKMIRTKDQLVEKRQFLRRYFDELYDLNEQVKIYAQNHPSQVLPPLDLEAKELSDQLKLELLRVSRLDGGREIIEECRQSRKLTPNY